MANLLCILNAQTLSTGQTYYAPECTNFKGNCSVQPKYGYHHYSLNVHTICVDIADLLCILVRYRQFFVAAKVYYA